MVNPNSPLLRHHSDAGSVHSVHDAEARELVAIEAAQDEGKVKVVDMEGTDDWTVPDAIKKHPLFVPVDASSNMVDAFRELDSKMRKEGLHGLLTGKTKHSWGGKRVEAGNIGVFEYMGAPVLALGPANYWNWSPTHSWKQAVDPTQQIAMLGLVSGQVGQSDAMVVKDPSNQVFVIRNGGFASFGAQGRFEILAVVDTLNLGTNTYEHENNDPKREALGQRKEILCGDRVVATFFNVPANNVVVVQKGNDIQVLGAGQHVITNPHTTYRGFYTLSERQWTYSSQPAYTSEGVPVQIDVSLRYRIADPKKLTRHYATAEAALTNPVQSAINAVVSRMSYQQFMRASSVAGDVAEPHAAPFVDAFRAASDSGLREQADSYGIVLESFTVLDRHWSDTMGKDLEKQAEKVMKNQVDATQVALQNRIATEQQEGQLQISLVQKKQSNTDAEAQLFKQQQQADGKFYAQQKDADGMFYTQVKDAEARAAAKKIETEQQVATIHALAQAEAERIRLVSEAYAGVSNVHAQAIQLQTLEIEKRKAMPASTVYFASEAGESDKVSSQFSTAFTSGLAAKMGIDAGAQK